MSAKKVYLFFFLERIKELFKSYPLDLEFQIAIHDGAFKNSNQMHKD